MINGSPTFRRAEDWPYGFDQAAVDGFLEVIDSVSLDEVAKALLDPAMREADAAGALAPLRAMFTAMTHEAGKETIRAFFTDISRDDDRALLERITAPTLILSSALGQEVPAAVALFMRERIPDARLAELPGADHFAFATQAGLVNRLIEQFIDPAPDVAPLNDKGQS